MPLSSYFVFRIYTCYTSTMYVHTFRMPTYIMAQSRVLWQGLPQLFSVPCVTWCLGIGWLHYIPTARKMFFFFSSWYLVGGGFVFTVKNTPYILVPGTYDHYSLPHWGNLWDLWVLNSLNTLLPYKSQLVFHQVKCFKFEAAAVGNFCCALAVHLLTVLSIVQIASIFSFWVQCDPHQYRCALIYKNILFT